MALTREQQIIHRLAREMAYIHEVEAPTELLNLIVTSEGKDALAEAEAYMKEHGFWYDWELRHTQP